MEDRLPALAFHDAVELGMLVRIVAETFDFASTDMRRFAWTIANKVDK